MSLGARQPKVYILCHLLWYTRAVNFINSYSIHYAVISLKCFKKKKTVPLPWIFFGVWHNFDN